MIKCCKCGSEIKSVKISHFNYDGSDSDVELPLAECKEMQYILKLIEIGAVMNFQKKNRRNV